MAAAGVPNGFQATLTTERYQEIPDYAVVIQNAVRKIGIDLTLNVEDQSAYYGRARLRILGLARLADGHRGLRASRRAEYLLDGEPRQPRALQRGAFQELRNTTRLAASYIAALDPSTQRACAGRIQRLLLEETPVIIAYFYDWLSVTAKHMSGVRPGANGQLEPGAGPEARVLSRASARRRA